MQVPHLDIQSNDAYIGLRSQRPGPQIRQHQADLQIRQQHSSIEISTTASKLYIDQTEAFADANLKSPLRMANEFWAKSESHVAQHIAKRSQQGEMMKKIENGFGAFAQIAKANSEKPMKQVVLGSMPKSAFHVKFDYQPAEVKVHAPTKQPEITVNRRDPDIQIPKWQTETYVRQKNSISFQAVGMAVNQGL
ncbi:DUF6470 family protein [Bacillus solitudinis]|uniref:DUF6470 family protein n=1 Tax=Bacillus solitudinis TaxID=2014074 RepID=UPI000C2325CF|nr:DUF6470 family protein [Bacillus solitudinis]